ncbi:hypothetical protein OESDEN_00299 [Oesophagostomum dentatum]|uniref:Peptidase M13 N-terminal domain-containing protein n=1 Tax=Oesophagostomum dentatum TaxID=61180 RepID=A0A0B1TV24_OESDE|nr:hypothetical protein OESDEN_00299 [Oesophagostomum dentatum]
MPRDYYILPKFTTRLSKRQEAIFNAMHKLAFHILDDHEIYTKMIQEAAQNVAELEMKIAMASWPDTQMRNFAQQYNAFNIAELKKAYPSIGWQSYLDKLLSRVGSVDFTGSNRKLIITQPSYFGWLNALFSGDFDQKTIVNYMITQLIFEDADFLGGIFKDVAESADYVPYAMRRGKGVARVGQQLTRTENSATDPNQPCINLMTQYMPYGTGFVYVKSKGAEERTKVKEDVSAQTELVLKNFVVSLFPSEPQILFLKNTVDRVFSEEPSHQILTNKCYL